jgi:SAM-dependent methyltransferase
MSNYDAVFFDYVNSGSIRSAEHVLPHLIDHVTIDSVLDVGCGQGAWLHVWNKLGITDYQGIDGDYVDRSLLLIDEDRFVARNLEENFDLGRRFDVVQSLEVAEHLPESAASRFVESLVRHGDLVLFSAAAKGQGGDNHINEQDYGYWQQLFARHGYTAIDYLRPLLKECDDVEPWFRYNISLYATSERLEKLPECIRSRQLSNGETLTDISPTYFKIRKLLVRMLPVSMVTWLSKKRQRWMTRAHSVQG